MINYFVHNIKVIALDRLDICKAPKLVLNLLLVLNSYIQSEWRISEHISLGLPLSIQGDWRVSEPKQPLVIDDEQYILIDPMFNCITLGLAVMKFLKI